jgi:hypothetical protein
MRHEKVQNLEKFHVARAHRKKPVKMKIRNKAL